MKIDLFYWIKSEEKRIFSKKIKEFLLEENPLIDLGVNFFIGFLFIMMSHY